MLSFDPINNTKRENYKLLTSSIIPRPIAFVTSLARDRTVNGAPFSYFNVVSSNPPMISLAIQRINGEPKDTARNIFEKKEFVVHLVDEENVRQINKTAASLPPNQSEIDIANLTLTDSVKVSVPGIKEAKVRFECVLDRTIELKVRNEVETDLIIGKIVRYHIENELYEEGQINQDKLAAVSRLGGPNYAKLGEVFSIERPK